MSDQVTISLHDVNSNFKELQSVRVNGEPIGLVRDYGEKSGLYHYAASVNTMWSGKPLFMTAHNAGVWLAYVCGYIDEDDVIEPADVNMVVQ